MDDPISARYEWNAEGLFDALESHRRQLRTTSDRLILGVILFLLALIFAATIWAVLWRPGQWAMKGRFLVGVVVVIGTILAVLYGTFLSKAPRRRAARKAFQHLPAGNRFVEWWFDESQLSNQTELTASTFLWPVFIKVVESPKGFMLYQNLTFFNWVPAHGFASPEAVRQFAALARSRVANYVVLSECRFPSKPEPIGVDEL
jgi:hypothetical protein